MNVEIQDFDNSTDKAEQNSSPATPDGVQVEEPVNTTSQTEESPSRLKRVINRIIARRRLLVLIAFILFTHGIAAKASLEFLAIAFLLSATAALTIPPIGEWLGLSTPHQERRSGEDKDTIVKNSFQALVNSLPEPAILLTKEGALVHFNAEAGDLLGDLEAGRHISSVVRNPEFLDAISRVHDTGGPITVYYSGRLPVGRRISSVIAKIEPQSDNLKAPTLLATFKDLTQLERLNQMRADFITNASHELRTPLASLMGFIETLQGPAKEDPEARDRFLKIMSTQAERMTRLINDLLSLSRVEMNVHLLPSDRVDINETVTHVVDTMELIAKDAKISLTLIPLPEPLYVRGERDELVQVFQNLIQNALKYNVKHGHVDVSLKHLKGEDDQPNAVTIIVEDDGPGISPEHLPRLTERFYRAEPSTNKEKSGTGLGLAIVKHIVTRHRGELEIHSTPGRGSRFSVFLNEWPSD